MLTEFALLKEVCSKLESSLNRLEISHSSTFSRSSKEEAAVFRVVINRIYYKIIFQ